jgi:hypothetical protein
MACTDSEDYEDNQTYARSAFHGPALKANNIMRLLDFACFRTEGGHTLRTRLALHCRDRFDLVSKYLLALKTHPRVGCALWNMDIDLHSEWYVSSRYWMTGMVCL